MSDQPAGTPRQTEEHRRRGSRRWLIASGCGLIVGSLAPWANFLELAQATGLQLGFGWVTLIAGATVTTIALDPAWLTRAPVIHHRRRALVTAAAVIAALDCTVVLVGLGDTGYGAAISPAWGLLLKLTSAATAAINARAVASEENAA